MRVKLILRDIIDELRSIKAFIIVILIKMVMQLIIKQCYICIII